MSTAPNSPLDDFEQAADDARDWPFTNMTWPAWFLLWLRPSTWKRLWSGAPDA